MKINIFPPDINRSDYQFTVNEQGDIVYGLGAIKGVGEAAINILLKREHRRPFKDLFDFCARVDLRKVNRRVSEALIRSGSFDSFGKHRALLFESLEDAIHSAEQRAKNTMQGQVDLFADSFTEEDLGVADCVRQVPCWSQEEILTGEKETLGYYLSGHPLEQYERELTVLATPIRELRPEKNKRVSIAGLIVNIRTLMTRKGDRMAFLTLEDRSGKQEVAVFSDTYNAKRELLVKDNLVVITGEVSPDEFSGGLKMRCIDLLDWETACARAAKYLKIEVRAEALCDAFTEKLAWTLKSVQEKSAMGAVLGKEGYIGNIAQAEIETRHFEKNANNSNRNSSSNSNSKSESKDDNNKGENNVICPVRIFYERAGAKSVLKLGDDWSVKPNRVLMDKLRALEGCVAVELQF